MHHSIAGSWCSSVGCRDSVSLFSQSGAVGFVMLWGCFPPVRKGGRCRISPATRHLDLHTLRGSGTRASPRLGAWGQWGELGAPSRYWCGEGGHRSPEAGQPASGGQWGDPPCFWGALGSWGLQGRGGTYSGDGSSPLKWIRAEVILKAREGLCKLFLHLLFIFCWQPIQTWSSEAAGLKQR